MINKNKNNNKNFKNNQTKCRTLGSFPRAHNENNNQPTKIRNPRKVKSEVKQQQQQHKIDENEHRRKYDNENFISTKT